MKILTVVGARPQFIKAAVVSRLIKAKHKEILVHTGQHYDYNMSQIFFDEMNIPEPQYNLGISGKSHGDMTGNMIIRLEEVMIQEDPDALLLYGDTNSTLSGALAGIKLHIPIYHVEAGARLGSLDNPEEVNRVVTDHVSHRLLCSTASALESLRKEGLIEKASLVGDPMYDAYTYYNKKINCQPEALMGIEGGDYILPIDFYYATIHRPENTDKTSKMLEILSALEQLDYPCVYPVHPRNQKEIRMLMEKYSFKNIIAIRPVGYLMSIYLIKHARKIITDSGGLQREAFFAEKQCITVFDYIMWPETMVGKRNQMAKATTEDILDKVAQNQIIDKQYKPFGDGNSAEKIACIIEEG